MIPASYLSPATAAVILNTLQEGQGTTQGSNNSYSFAATLTGGLITANLRAAIEGADLSTVTTISTAGLTTAEIDALNGMRSRIVEGLNDQYSATPKQNPLNDPNTGAPVLQADQDHRVDVILQTIFYWDARYFLRQRSDVGTDAVNSEYELPSRYNFLSHPMIISTTRLHGFTSNAANIGPSAARVSCATPHGYYDGLTIQDMATVSATTWTANVNQAFASTIDAVDTYFLSNATPSFSTGNDINVNVPSTANSAFFWTALNNLGLAQVGVTGNQLRFYRDIARTDQIKASWGNIISTDWQGAGTINERVAVNADGQHLIIPGAPLQFNNLSGNTQSSVYELKYTNSYNPVTQTFTSNVAGYSVYDKQIVNLTTNGTSTVYINPIADDTPMYFKKASETSFQIYRTVDLAAGNVWAFGNTSTISNIAYSSGDSVWQVNFDSTVAYPPLMGGQDIRFVNTTGASKFSTPVSLTQNSAGGNIQITSNSVYFFQGNVGTVGGRDRLVVGNTNNFAYTDDGARWTTASVSPTGGWIDQISWNSTANRFEARVEKDPDVVGGPDFYIWTSTNGATWANVSTYSYSFTAPTEDIWLGRGEYDGYTLIQNNSTGEMRVARGANTYPIRFGLTLSLLNGSNSNIRTTTNVIYVLTPTAVYRVAKTSINTPSAWAVSTANISPSTAQRITATELVGLKQDNGFFYFKDNGPGTSGFGLATLTYTVNGTTTPVTGLGYIRGNYIFANAQTTGVTEGYYKETIDSGALAYSYDDRYTATGHPFTTGQQVRASATFNYNGTVITPPQNLWVEVFDNNSIDLFINEERTIGYNSGRPSGSMSASTITPVFYVKYRSARTWDLYLGSDITDTNNKFSDNTKMTGGTTTGGTVWNGYITSVVDDTASFIRPLFFPQYRNGTSVSLWVDVGRTIPYAYFGRNGTLLNQQTAYTTSGRYFLNNIGHRYAIGSDDKIDNVVIGLNTTPMYYAKVINDYVVDLYSDSALTNAYRQVTWANSAATLWQANPSSTAPYRLDTIYVPNIGTKTYFTTNLTTSTTTVNATWAGSGRKYYSRYNQTQSIYTNPTLNVAEHTSNAAAAYGGLRYAYTSGPGGTGNVAVVDGSIYGGFGGSPTPVYYNLNAPGRLWQNADILFGIGAEPNSGSDPALADPALAYTGEQWATASNLTDRELRRWPTTIAPQSMTWTIEQPNSTIETYNLTRYSRARDVTQYRMRLVYPPMTKAQVAEFTNVIHAARGSFKPIVFTPPFNSTTQQYVTIKVGEKNETTPAVFRIRNTVNSGEQVLKVDGLPPSLDLTAPAFDAGWAIELPIRNSTGSWGIVIHDVQTNAYGEANMRLNNNIASELAFGAALGADAADLDVFIDADSVELKVDTRGFHFLEIDLVTKRIF